MQRRRTAQGFTLVECAVVCAVVGVLSAIALPSMRGHALRAARIDAVDALTRLQASQEQHRMLHGLYASDLRALRGVGTTSRQGRYTLQLINTGADGYRASAVATGVQTADTACPALTLEVARGFAEPGPSGQCWNR